MVQSIDSDESLANQIGIVTKNADQRKQAPLLTSNVFDTVEYIQSEFEMLCSREEQSYTSKITLQSKSQVVSLNMTGDTKDLALYVN